MLTVVVVKSKCKSINKNTGLQRAGVGERRSGTRDAELLNLHRDVVCGHTDVLRLLL